MTQSPTPLNTPVLFLIFNRPETTQRVFEAIRAARPPRLYVAGDGPRADNENDAVRVREARQIATAVDWPCEVSTLFRDENLGCKLGPSQAITWFFRHEERGIILEDDCVPESTFFDYCEWALDEFSEEPKVWHVNGNNYDAPPSLFGGADTAFIPLPQVWGWATWRDRWTQYQANPFYLVKPVVEHSRDWRISGVSRANKLRHLGKLLDGLDAWGYQWQMTVLNARGLAMCPRSNLISNIGDGSEATHTSGGSNLHLPTRPFTNSGDTGPIEVNDGLTRWYEARMGLRNRLTALAYTLNRLLVEVGSRLKRVSSRVLFGVGRPPIVVASTGRSGSTLLCDSIADGLIAHRFGRRLPPLFMRALRYVAMEFADRLADIDGLDYPVLKTHDFPQDGTLPDGKYLFVFGPPLESAQSVVRTARSRGNAWFEKHLHHLRAHGFVSDLFRADVLNFESQVNAWMSVRADDVFMIPFDELWERTDEISRFVGVDIRLPQRNPRQPKSAVADIDRELFAQLDALFEQAVQASRMRRQAISSGTSD